MFLPESQVISFQFINCLFCRELKKRASNLLALFFYLGIEITQVFPRRFRQLVACWYREGLLPLLDPANNHYSPFR